jgi:hypothetical protein
MDHNLTEWASYLGGALLALAYKYARYLYTGHQSRIGWKELTWEWFFDPCKENAVSWVTTVGVVWIIGSLYIERMDWEVGGNFLKSLPVQSPVAFTLGSMMEFVAPNISKWFVAMPWPWAKFGKTQRVKRGRQSVSRYRRPRGLRPCGQNQLGYTTPEGLRPEHECLAEK